MKEAAGDDTWMTRAAHNRNRRRLMEMPAKSPRSSRENFLTFALVAVLGGAFFVFLNLVSFGIFFYVLAAVVGIAALGFLHYVVWGYDLSEEVAEERKREWLKQQADMDEPDRA
jgi:hypothetical protein